MHPIALIEAEMKNAGSEAQFPIELFFAVAPCLGRSNYEFRDPGIARIVGSTCLIRAIYGYTV
ncbi:hypothetical protein GCM10023333_03000 [Ferrimonas pelagia]|uniref:Uncharacterized protein n=1 Tax=Ferrimonas pelagia TaxID=1177826 RepID=A0ABP9EDH8_9GAMM